MAFRIGDGGEGGPEVGDLCRRDQPVALAGIVDFPAEEPGIEVLKRWVLFSGDLEPATSGLFMTISLFLRFASWLRGGILGHHCVLTDPRRPVPLRIGYLEQG
jgi:hypothetical protein